MRELLDRLTRINLPARQKEGLAGKIVTLGRAEMFDPRLSRIYYTDVSELPDNVKNHPVTVQRAYLVTFNNVLRNTGSTHLAAVGAVRAMRTRLEQLRAEERRRRKSNEPDGSLIHWAAKRTVQGPQVQIVVP